MPSKTLEERLAALETEMAQVKQRLGQETPPKTPHWVDQIFGVFENDLLFEDAVRYGREWRNSQRMDEETDAPA